MTKRIPINASQIIWRDGQQVDRADMATEQSSRTTVDSAVVNNFFGSGLMLASPTRQVIFDSDNLTAAQQTLVASTNFDGQGISPHNQPTDTSLGNQLEVTLSECDGVTTRKSVKVCIIGLDFDNNLQFETFSFYKNETVVGKKHFKSVISLLFNDFKGNNNSSIELGGRVVIKEAQPMQLSRDVLMASQNLEPNLFFRDFKVANQYIGPNNSVALQLTLQNAIGSYNADLLPVYTGYNTKYALEVDDITTRYGQKFLANAGNIQKVRMLLGVEKDLAAPDSSTWFDWSGDIIISIHELQTTVTCPTDTIPDNEIEYDPNPSAIAQIVVTKATLLDQGIVLTDVAQPVDFIFSTTKLGLRANSIRFGSYYVVTIKRAGDTSTGELFVLAGRNLTEDSRATVFNGTSWTDNANVDFWFEVYTAALKVADGMGYDEGSPVVVDKTYVNSSGVTADYCEDGISLANNGESVVNHVVVQAVAYRFNQVQNERTGQPVLSQQKTQASVSCITDAQLTSLKSTEDPIVLGYAFDANPKSTTTITGNQTYFGLAGTNVFNIINPSSSLKAKHLVGGKFNPNTGNIAAKTYKIYRATLCVDGYGDLDGDGVVSISDYERAAEIVSLNGSETITTAATQTRIANGDFTAIELIRADIDGDGVVTPADVAVIGQLANKDTTATLPHGSTFERLVLYVENYIGRTDAYHSSYAGYARLYNPEPYVVVYADLDTNELLYYGNPVPVDVSGNELALTTVSNTFSVPYSVVLPVHWREDLVKVTHVARLIPCSFTYMTGPTVNDCSAPVANPCADLEPSKSYDGGRNVYFVPGDLMLGENSQIISTDGSSYPIDFETNTITLELPALAINDKTINIFTTFVAEEDNGFTSKGFAAMKFANCSYVQSNALSLNQVRFSAAIMSLAQNLDGYSIDDGYGAIVDPMIGVHIDSNGVLRLSASNLQSDTTQPTMMCRVTVTVMLKKAGWKNTAIIVLPNESETLLGL